MKNKISLFGRTAGAATALAVAVATLAAPAAAMPFAKSGVATLGDVATVQFNKPGGHPGGHPGGFHPGGGHPGGFGHGHGGPGWGHHGGWGGAGIGAAIGFGILGAAAAAAAYGAPPQPGMCWYYDNPMHSSGHWDYCQ
jgi:hypothetical protein